MARFIIRISKEDEALFNAYDWRVYQVYPGKWYLARSERGLVYFHREVMGRPPRQEVDHINRRTLDNRRQNLRVVSTRGNQLNRDFQIKLYRKGNLYRGRIRMPDGKRYEKQNKDPDVIRKWWLEMDQIRRQQEGL